MALADFLSSMQAVPDNPTIQALATASAQPAPVAAPVHQPSKFRNFLGAIGDALLVAHGAQPLYRERMQQQRAQGALQGFLANPDQAIAQLMQVDAPDAISLFKAVHPASETPLELKLLQHLKDHPEDANALHQIDAELHPGMGTPIQVDAGSIVGGQPVGGADYSGLQRVSDQKSYDAVPPGASYVTPDGHVRQKPGGATASTPSPTFR